MTTAKWEEILALECCSHANRVDSISNNDTFPICIKPSPISKRNTTIIIILFFLVQITINYLLISNDISIYIITPSSVTVSITMLFWVFSFPYFSTIQRSNYVTFVWTLIWVRNLMHCWVETSKLTNSSLPLTLPYRVLLFSRINVTCVSDNPVLMFFNFSSSPISINALSFE